ncbi:S8 family serine peptidase [Streptomyces sp. NPDC058092]|uniref:S8 family serine peptidase n=1 Tax=Streptomyces sp. NPDC058092 TaxID=3346336 RepID=UPI0036E55A95
MAIAASALALTGTAANAADPEAGTAAAATSAAAAKADKHDKIKPALHDKLRSKGKADYWVHLSDAADLTEAGRIKDWTKRGTAVAKALRKTAAASQADVLKELRRAHLDYEAFWATNAIHVTGGSLEMAEQLASEPEVEALWPVLNYTAPEPSAGRTTAEIDAVEWGIANINADDVWEKYGTKGEGITVANIDTGVQYDHPALVKQYRGNLGDGTFDHNYNWFDAAGTCDGAPCDTAGHGTHTMGTMAGDEGGDNHIGVAPGVKWIASNACCATDTALIAAAQWMLEPTDLQGKNPDAGKRPNVINNSYGSSTPSNDPFMEDISLAWTASGIFGVWANGNNGSGCATSGSPGSRTVNYSVGAYDGANTIASFSSRGAGQDGEIKPNISAPGVNVRSSIPGSGYASYNGTSMATPHVAGAIALLWSAAPSMVGDVEGTKALLDDTGIDTPDSQCGGTDGDNNVYGEGRLDALAMVSHAPGQVSGRITDAVTGKPLVGASVTTGEVTAVSDSDGHYRLPVTDGHYTLTFSAFGYQDTTADVSVGAGEPVTRDIALTPLPRVHVTGKVTDGSGQGWPLYAKITVSGDPAPHHTDPYTGAYDLVLPADRSHRLTVDPDLDGYPTLTRETAVGSDDSELDIPVPVDTLACNAPGYAVAYDGLTQTFDTTGTPDGWAVTDAAGNGEGWRFDNPLNRGNRTQGKGSFATVNSLAYDQSHTQDTTLTAPVVDLSGVETATLQFNTYLIGTYGPSHVYVDLSVDSGENWKTVWERNAVSVSGSQQSLDVPQAAGKSQVQLRFRYTGGGRNVWQVDDVHLGGRSCAPQATGLVVGHVTDGNTGAGLNKVKVADSSGTPTATSKSTPDDAALEDGFYTLPVSAGEHSLSAGTGRYTTVTKTVKVTAHALTRTGFPLPAGQLEVSGAVDRNVTLGGGATASFTVKNTGGAPADVTLNEARGRYSLLSAPTSTPRGAAATTSKHALAGTASAPDPVEPTAAGSDWVYGPSTPVGLADNVVGAYDGKVYTVGGVQQDAVGYMSLTKAGYVLDPRGGGWKPIADQPTVRDKANGAFVGGKLYVTGGWSADHSIDRSLDVYDPGSNTWSSGATAPTGYAASGVATLDGRLYLVGGCTTTTCGTTDVWVYTPDTDRWQKAASYPQSTSWLSCGSIAGKIYCAGGTTEKQGSRKTYVYDPATGAWTAAADMPIDIWGASYSAAGGLLIVSGGASANGSWIDMENYAYDPSANTWSALPAFTVQPTYRGGGACGFYAVGGGYGEPGWLTRILPGFDVCDEGDASWLSLDKRRLTVQPGKSVTVAVGLNAAAASITQPGDLTAEITVDSDTPYRVVPVDVAMHVSPPKSWGKVGGSVTGVDCDGVSAPLAGASVNITTSGGEYPLITDKSGHYGLWIDKKYGPVTVIAADRDFVSQVKSAKIKAGETSTADFALKSSLCLG